MMPLERSDIEALIHALNENTMTNHALFETIEELRQDLVHELRNLTSAGAGEILTGSKDPPRGPAPAVQLCQCDLCDKQVPVDQAKDWSGVGPWKRGSVACLGICPSCIETAKETKTVPARPQNTVADPQKPAKTGPKSPRTSLFPSDE